MLNREKSDLTSLQRIIFITYLTLDAVVDLCVVDLMMYKIAQVQLQSKAKNRLFSILLPRLL